MRGIVAFLLTLFVLNSFAAAQILDHGAVIRGDITRKRVALVFTGGEFSDSAVPILDTLQKFHIRAALFVTGDFLRLPGNDELLRRALREGHYVGPHSDRHLLYCSWENRELSLVSEAQFKADLQKNIDDLNRLGAPSATPTLFIPPYEWFNAQHVRWAAEMNVQVFNFSPGSGSNRDYMPESDAHFVSSQKLFERILSFEKQDPHGLNGYILLIHLGADRKDKFHPLLGRLISELQLRGYQFVRIDDLLKQ